MQRGLTWAVDIVGIQKVFSLQVRLTDPPQQTGGRPGKHPITSEDARAVKDVLNGFPPHRWPTVKGGKTSRWVAMRVRIADGVPNKRGLHLPGEEVWIVGEKRRGGAVKYYTTTHSASTPLTHLIRDIKARWACEVLHLQCKEELSLDHFEGRSLRGLEHHVALVLLMLLFLQTLRSPPGERFQPALTVPQARRAVCQALESLRTFRGSSGAAPRKCDPTQRNAQPPHLCSFWRHGSTLESALV